MNHLARSPRQASDLHAVLVDGDVQSAGRVRDISFTGLMVAGPVGLHVGRRLTVVRMVDEAEGPRRPAEVVRRDGRDGAGLRFLPPSEDRELPADAPSLFLAEAWGEEGEWLTPLPVAPLTVPSAASGSPLSVPPSARFAVRPDTIERLRRFLERDVEAGRTVLFTRELRAPGTHVAVSLVHPATELPLDLAAMVIGQHAAEPRRLELAFLAPIEQRRAEVARFLETGDPHPPLLEPTSEVVLENAGLRARVAELEEALEESERTERAILARLHELERLQRR